MLFKRIKDKKRKKFKGSKSLQNFQNKKGLNKVLKSTYSKCDYQKFNGKSMKQTMGKNFSKVGMSEDS